MRFSERNRFVQPRVALQLEGMDDALRASLWNVVQEQVWDTHQSTSGYSHTEHSNLILLIKQYWKNYFKIPTNDIPDYISQTIAEVRSRFFGLEWYEVYDFIEFTAELLAGRTAFDQGCNHVLEREMSGYRLADTGIVPITSENELATIEEALTQTDGLRGANAHLKQALALLSDRRNPDYRNSIKESISAVEAVCRSIADQDGATLREALKVISAKAPMHPALNKSLSSLYGYTSDADGIRHALLDEEHIDFVDAKFMLSACSAFVNYLLGKTSQQES